MTYEKKKYPLNCFTCKNDFFGRERTQKTCSQDCRNKRNIFLTGRSSNKSIPTGTVGAISEMSVAMFLMDKGYAVFRALSPACICDLVVIKDEKILRLEVRTGYEDEKGKITFPSSDKDKGRQDFFAINIRSKNKIRFFTHDKREVSEI